MEVSLKKMNEESFAEYLQFAIPAYASENIRAGRWPTTGDLERSKLEYADLFPEGLKTKDNYLFNIVESSNDIEIGHLWVKITSKENSKSAFIYDLHIHESYRGKGYAKAALLCTEHFASSLGADSISLHVFNHNDVAKALYKKVGYEVISHNMRKTIDKC
ncbi:GNAT family N-acetyltransferase [Veronia nyctiphanis]|uniref:GNAT family N-acetyltransferase n=1 Tax=Veronia nyctiphanis TaxID=1278244 RepID=A0A4Q0YRJ0_9GAMM|nr:GNAT family N-acetyltransferase [Veronia nyctiphanis]RXJ72724.1 GNAT family N-acetyltransferase [Veronia nyctiphanis]